MAQALNQFQQTAERGQVAYLNCDSFKMSAVVDSSEAGTLAAGDAVKIVTTSKGIPHIVKVGSGDTSCFGFVAFNAVKNAGIVAGDRVEVVFTGAFMYMVASAAINAGAALDYAYSTGKVATANSGLGCGIAMEAASGDGDLIAVYVKTI